MAVRRGRLARDLLDSTLADLSTLPINMDPETDRQAWGPTLRLAARYGLSVYDAAYLEVASRRALPLATLDDALRSAAEQHQIALLGK
jgi:predicted nucleic acid-binding protein